MNYDNLSEEELQHILFHPKMTDELLEKYAGKYIQWNNGLRLKVLGASEDYPNEFVVREARGDKQWNSVIYNIVRARIISEEEALAEHAMIKQDVPQAAICACGAWRMGKKNVSIKFKLKDGKIPTDEADRIEHELRDFFKSHGISPRVGYSEEGVHLEFFSYEQKIEREEKCGPG